MPSDVWYTVADRARANRRTLTGWRWRAPRGGPGTRARKGPRQSSARLHSLALDAPSDFPSSSWTRAAPSCAPHQRGRRFAPASTALPPRLIRIAAHFPRCPFSRFAGVRWPPSQMDEDGAHFRAVAPRKPSSRAAETSADGLDAPDLQQGQVSRQSANFWPVCPARCV